MADIQSVTAEKMAMKERRKKPQLQNIMSTSAMQGGHKKFKTH